MWDHFKPPQLVVLFALLLSSRAFTLALQFGRRAGVDVTQLVLSLQLSTEVMSLKKKKKRRQSVAFSLRGGRHILCL